jgi:hypothetical protein
MQRKRVRGSGNRGGRVWGFSFVPFKLKDLSEESGSFIFCEAVK